MENQTTAYAYAYAHSYIAPELLARLRNLKNHKGHLPRQVNSFSSNYYHPGLMTHRWYLPHSGLQYPHLITTKENGVKLDLFILKSQQKTVLHLKMTHGLWWIEEVFDESDIGAFLPAHTAHSGGRLRSPASSNQMQKLSHLLLLPRNDLPKLTRYNASVIIQEILVAADLDEIMALIGPLPSNMCRAV